MFKDSPSINAATSNLLYFSERDRFFESYNYIIAFLNQSESEANKDGNRHWYHQLKSTSEFYPIVLILVKYPCQEHARFLELIVDDEQFSPNSLENEYDQTSTQKRILLTLLDLKAGYSDKLRQRLLNYFSSFEVLRELFAEQNSFFDPETKRYPLAELNNFFDPKKKRYRQNVLLARFGKFTEEQQKALLSTLLDTQHYRLVESLYTDDQLNADMTALLKNRLLHEKQNNKLVEQQMGIVEDVDASEFRQTLADMLSISVDAPIDEFSNVCKAFLRQPDNRQLLLANPHITAYLCRSFFTLVDDRNFEFDEWEAVLYEQIGHIHFRSAGRLYHESTNRGALNLRRDKMVTAQYEKNDYPRLFLTPWDFSSACAALIITAASQKTIDPEQPRYSFVLYPSTDDVHVHPFIAVIDRHEGKVKAWINIDTNLKDGHTRSILISERNFKDNGQTVFIFDASIQLQVYKNDNNCYPYTSYLLSTIDDLLAHDSELRESLTQLGDVEANNESIIGLFKTKLIENMPEFFRQTEEGLWVPKGAKAKFNWALRQRWEEGRYGLLAMHDEAAENQQSANNLLAKLSRASSAEKLVDSKPSPSSFSSSEKTPTRYKFFMAPDTPPAVPSQVDLNLESQNKLKVLKNGCPLTPGDMQDLKVRPLFKRKSCYAFDVSLGKKHVLLSILDNLDEIKLIAQSQGKETFLGHCEREIARLTEGTAQDKNQIFAQLFTPDKAPIKSKSY